MKIIVIVPTYNEVDNIVPLIDALHIEFQKIDHELEVLVVDDYSPDGTADCVREAMTKYSWIHLIEGNKEGLGRAYIRGIRHASRVLGGDAVVEMDADFSHRPEDLPRLIAKLDEGYDFVIGSRYVESGSIPENWGLHRKLISAVGNWATRLITGLRVRDCTAGFRIIRCRILEEINLGHLAVNGYAFQVALLNRCVRHGAKVIEIPVDFIDRVRGTSKLGLRDILEFLFAVWWIRLHNHATFIKFSIVGISGILVNLGLFTLLIEAGLSKYMASPIAIEASIISNFYLNHNWTFMWRKSIDNPQIKGLKFHVVSLASLLLSYATFFILTTSYADVAPQVWQAVGVVPAALVNYFLNAYWTFKPATPTNL
ncbi:MAG: dolichol-phosphate mannosyltransferase [Alphaproteobacteria bacterium]|jgi:dolichol-phosphate mannosyltransferase